MQLPAQKAALELLIYKKVHWHCTIVTVSVCSLP